jgi:endonuclease YncB( thermonuclease family)
MLHPYQILLPLLSLFWVRVDLTDLFPLKIPVHVLDIRDGDTLTAKAGHRIFKVRLSRIDAPELHQPFHLSKQDAGYFSRDCVRAFSPKEGTLTIEGFDLYHRVLGDFENINYKAVQNGCAGIYPHARFTSVSQKMKYLKALIAAKKARRGVWGHGGYVLPKTWRKISKRSADLRWHRSRHSRVPYRPGRKRARKEY